MAGVPQETPVWVKSEETDIVANEPDCMNLEDPLSIYPGFNIKQDPDVDGSKYNVQFYPSSVHVKEEMEDSMKQEFLEDPLRVEGPGLSTKQDPELNVDDCEPNFLEDPLCDEGPGLRMKKDPELNKEYNEM